VAYVEISRDLVDSVSRTDLLSIS